MVAYVERQGARPRQGLSSTFTSATAFGSLLATLQIAGCSIELVTASQWKTAMSLTKDKGVSQRDGQSSYKSMLRAFHFCLRSLRDVPVRSRTVCNPSIIVSNVRQSFRAASA